MILITEDQPPTDVDCIELASGIHMELHDYLAAYEAMAGYVEAKYNNGEEVFVDAARELFRAIEYPTNRIADFDELQDEYGDGLCVFLDNWIRKRYQRLEIKAGVLMGKTRRKNGES